MVLLDVFVSMCHCKLAINYTELQLALSRQIARLIVIVTHDYHTCRTVLLSTLSIKILVQKPMVHCGLLIQKQRCETQPKRAECGLLSNPRPLKQDRTSKYYVDDIYGLETCCHSIHFSKFASSRTRNSGCWAD